MSAMIDLRDTGIEAIISIASTKILNSFLLSLSEERREELDEIVYDTFLDCYHQKVKPLFEREERELAFRRSGEAGAENKADDAHDKLWYQRLMNSSIGEPND